MNTEKENNFDSDNVDIISDKYIRIVAEFENYKKRTKKEIEQIKQCANEDIIKELLFVLDDFNRATDLNSGVILIKKKIEKILNSNNVVKIDSLDKKFDPDYHEALTQKKVENKEGIIVDVIEEGYRIGNKIIRFAKVVVGS